MLSRTLLLFYTRRSDLTPAEFQEYMEQKYIPILKETMGAYAPIATTLRFTERCGSGYGDRLGAKLASKYRNHPDAPVLLVGHPKDLGWDAMMELSFKDDLHLMQGYAVVNGEEGQRVHDSEAEFTVPEAMKVVLMERNTMSSPATEVPGSETCSASHANRAAKNIAAWQ
ncbi:hypothetical protein OPT61_g5637 [Boeremia exigua]|uniref:Uncharacterized protein n=1 Tax=Boeremia exigua TaxID=749465 RepID=A0ACC2I9L3_9PLEO|nr:hypothetical protein OPT61_g5637 [Boeremia exigua]